MDFLTTLNQQQRKAIEHGDGPLVIIAGAGSGKTLTLTGRIAYQIAQRKIPARRILATTFTRKAAIEMQNRLVRLVGNQARQAWIGTFHSLCARMLRQHGHYINLNTQFSIYDKNESEALMKEILAEEEIRCSPAELLKHISKAKNNLQQQLHSSWENFIDERDDLLFKKYQRRLRKLNALDFDDLIFECVRLLTISELRAYWSERFQYALVDEFQDTNFAQFRWVELLTSKHRNLCVVGDDDQTIYAWRGADASRIINFSKIYPNARVIHLEQNYRSTSTILDAANGIISQNKVRSPKKLWTNAEKGDQLSLHGAYTADNEVEWVAKQIIDLYKTPGFRYNEVAILCRINAQTRIFEEIFRTLHIPLRLRGTQNFYKRFEIKHLINYLRFLQSPHNDIALLPIINVPGRGIEGSIIEELKQRALKINGSLWEALGTAAADPFSPSAHSKLLSLHSMLSDLYRHSLEEEAIHDLLVYLTEKLQYKAYLQKGRSDATERISNVEELVTVAEDFHRTSCGEKHDTGALGRFLDMITLEETARQEDKVDAVTMMTIHNAKGLEFPYVFMVGMEDGYLPHFNALQDTTKNALEEERRVCYVGMTRAKKRLFLSYASRRNFNRSTHNREPSEFLNHIPSDLLNCSGAAKKASAASDDFEYDDDSDPFADDQDDEFNWEDFIMQLKQLGRIRRDYPLSPFLRERPDEGSGEN